MIHFAPPLQYYDAMDITEVEKKERMKSCRHKGHIGPPKSPLNLWKIEFPDTQQLNEQGRGN